MKSLPYLKKCIAVFSLVLAAIVLPATHSRAAVTEHDIIAKILVSLPHYAKLPQKKAGFITLCVDGNDALFQAALKQNSKQHMYASVYQRLDRSAPCDFAYVESIKKVRKILNSDLHLSTLLISHYPRFIDEGGPIGVVIIDGRVQIEINLSAAARLKVELSPDLIEISERIIQ